MKPEWLDRSLMTGPYYTLCTTEEQFRREVRKLKVPGTHKFLMTGHADATTHHLINLEGERCCIVCMPDRPDMMRVQLYGLLVRKAVHIWQEFLERIGETDASHEFEAYSIQRIAQSLMAEFDRQTGPKRR